MHWERMQVCSKLYSIPTCLHTHIHLPDLYHARKTQNYDSVLTGWDSFNVIPVWRPANLKHNEMQEESRNSTETHSVTPTPHPPIFIIIFKLYNLLISQKSVRDDLQNTVTNMNLARAKWRNKVFLFCFVVLLTQQPTCADSAMPTSLSCFSTHSDHQLRTLEIPFPTFDKRRPNGNIV